MLFLYGKKKQKTKTQKSDGGSTEIRHNYLKINDTKRYQSRLEGLWQWCSLSEVCVCTQLLSHVRLFATPRTVALQAPLSIGILRGRILEWVAIPFFRGSSQPRDWTWVSHITGRFFTIWATREAPWYLGLEQFIRLEHLGKRVSYQFSCVLFAWKASLVLTIWAFTHSNGFYWKRSFINTKERFVKVSIIPSKHHIGINGT